MQGGNIHAMEIVLLLLLLFVVAFGELARRLKTPYPIVLVVGGLLVSFIPGIPTITLNPDVIFLLVMPTLLFSAAWVTSWLEFSFNFVSIFFLAFGLVGFSVLGVAYAAPWVLPGFDWRMGLVLGAVIGPTDAIAAPRLPSALDCRNKSSTFSRAKAWSLTQLRCSRLSLAWQPSNKSAQENRRGVC